MLFGRRADRCLSSPSAAYRSPLRLGRPSQPPLQLNLRLTQLRPLTVNLSPHSTTPFHDRSDPVIVLSLAVVFVFSVVFLHLFTKGMKWFLK